MSTSRPARVTRASTASVAAAAKAEAEAAAYDENEASSSSSSSSWYTPVTRHIPSISTVASTLKSPFVTVPTTMLISAIALCNTLNNSSIAQSVVATARVMASNAKAIDLVERYNKIRVRDNQSRFDLWELKSPADKLISTLFVDPPQVVPTKLVEAQELARQLYTIRTEMLGHAGEYAVRTVTETATAVGSAVSSAAHTFATAESASQVATLAGVTVGLLALYAAYRAYNAENATAEAENATAEANGTARALRGEVDAAHARNATLESETVALVASSRAAEHYKTKCASLEKREMEREQQRELSRQALGGVFVRDRLSGAETSFDGVDDNPLARAEAIADLIMYDIIDAMDKAKDDLIRTGA